MRKFKNIVASFALAVFTVTCFSACSKGDDGDKKPQKTTEQKVVEILDSARANMLKQNKMEQTFSSYYIDENDIDIEMDNSNVLEDNAIVSITTQVSDGVESSYVEMTDENLSYYETYEKVNNGVVCKIYDPEEKIYVASTKTEEQIQDERFETFRADYDYVAIYKAMKKAEAPSASVSYACELTEDDGVKTATITKTVAENNVLKLTFKIKNKLVEQYVVEKTNLVMDQTFIATVNVKFADVEDLDFDKNEYLSEDFDPINYIDSLYTNIQTKGIENHKVTEIVEDKTYETYYSKQDNIEKILVKNITDNKTLVYIEIEPIESDDACTHVQRVYDVETKKYTEKNITTDTYLSTLQEYGTAVYYIKLIESLSSISGISFNMYIEDGAYVFNIKLKELTEGFAPFETTAVVENDKIVSFEDTIGEDTIETTISYETDDIVFDKTGFTLQEPEPEPEPEQPENSEDK